MKTILVTGGAGFIGSNFIDYMLKRYDDCIVNLDALTYAGRLENLSHIAQHPKYIFVQGDVRDRLLVERLFSCYAIDTVIHFAAESHVDRSIEDPSVFVSTNVLGTQVLLDVAKQHWKVEPHNPYCRKYKKGTKFIYISTDEVYGALGETGFFTENTSLAPNSPYAASKAGADLMVRAYYETYGLPINITRCSNNYGPYQHPEKLIPMVITKALHNESIPLYGDGQQVRDWLYVEDHCRAIDIVLRQGEIGEVYNIGGHNERTNEEIVKLILKQLNKSETLIEYVQDRPGHDRRYAIDHSKITKRLKWVPQYSFEKGLNETIEWYISQLNYDSKKK